MRKLNVLSCFDGISTGRLALERAGIPVRHYFSFEIDKWAIQTAQKNYPDTIQLGDVLEWDTWEFPRIDLLIGGSPCQGFSNVGAGLNFDDPRSALFFTFVKILETIRPKYFLLENVKMKREWRDIITECMGVDPILINSSLVSAQNRERYYWTNIKGITQPEDKGLVLQDILEDGEADRDKSYAIDANYYKGGSLRLYTEKRRRQIIHLPSDPIHKSEKRLMVMVGHADIKGHDSVKRVYSHASKSPTLTGMGGGHQQPKVAIDGEHWRKLTPIECERLQTFPDNYTAGVSNTQRYKQLGNSWTVDVIAHIFSFLTRRK